MDKIIEQKNGEYTLDVTLHLDLNYDRIAGLKIDGVSDADILKRVKKDIIVMQSFFVTDAEVV